MRWIILDCGCDLMITLVDGEFDTLESWGDCCDAHEGSSSGSMLQDARKELNEREGI